MAKSVKVTNLESEANKEFIIEWPVKSLEILARQIAFCLSNMTGHVFDFSDFSKYKANINNLYLYKVMAMQNFKVELEDVADEPCFIELKTNSNTPPLYRRLNDIPYQIEDVVRLPVTCSITDEEHIDAVIEKFLKSTYLDNNCLLTLNEVDEQLCTISIIPKQYTKVE